jgi:serine/threonine-protein kinase
LVKRGASKTTSVLELYNILAASLEREDDRRAFLAKRAELFGGKANVQFTKLATPIVTPPPAAPLDASLPVEITPAAIELAARRLAAHLGPIAPILARKEARRATNLRQFYELLAEHLGNPADRERFLKEAGVAMELPPAGSLAQRNETLSINARSAIGDPPAGQFKPELKGE